MTQLGTLRSMSEKDLDLIRSWRNHPNIASKMLTRHKISADEHSRWWERTSRREDQVYFLFERSTVPLGVVAFTQIDPINKNCFWAFYADPAAPKGTGSQMEYLALDYAFGVLELKKICCEVLAFNKPVIGLHKKFGFQIEGVFRNQHNFDDKYIDIVRLGLLDYEWIAVRERFDKIFQLKVETEI